MNDLNMQNYKLDYEIYHACIKPSLFAPQMANITTDSLLDETSCTDLCNIIL